MEETGQRRFLRGVQRERWGERVEAGKEHDAGHTFGAERPAFGERESWRQTADLSAEKSFSLQAGPRFVGGAAVRSAKRLSDTECPILRERFSSESIFRGLLRTFPLLHQPARQHAGGVFLHPQIEKRADLLRRLAAWLNRRIFAHGSTSGWRILRWRGSRRSMDRTGPRAWCCSASTICGSLRTKTRWHFLGLSEHNWVNWTEQIRHRCGKELLGRSMFPPRKYFTNTE